MNKPHMEKEPSDRTILVSALGWIGVIFVFFLIVAVAYLPNRAPSTEEKNAEIRYRILNEVKGDQAALVNSYQWVNQNEGTVRIPVEEAIKLTVEELRAEQQASAEPAP